MRRSEPRRVRLVALILTLLLGAGSVRPDVAAQGQDSPRTSASAPAVAGDHPRHAEATSVDADWWTTVQEQIRRSEYHVTWQDGTYVPGLSASYQAPNRAHNLRTYFTPKGLIVIPRTWGEESTAAPWRSEIRLAAWGRAGGMTPAREVAVDALDNRVRYSHDLPSPPSEVAALDGPQLRLIEEYRNGEQGLAQGITLPVRPSGAVAGGSLRFEFALGGDLIPEAGSEGNELTLRAPDGSRGLLYTGLRADDADGNRLSTWLILEGSTLTIGIDDGTAAYPIQVEARITGLDPDHDWGLTFGQEDAEFGTSVATAGDVDGDGYSEVIIGAPNYDDGHAEAGAAFVYYGSSGGLYAFSDWIKTGGQSEANFGNAVATAGDVNGDGYADVIIGAPGYSDGQSGEGGMWVWHGSSDGLEDDWSKHGQGDRAGAAFGNSVGTAGDVNGDGFSDVIVGAPLHHLAPGPSEEGVVWVWHGSSSGLGYWSWRAEGSQLEASFGQSVATAGDINADGYADVIVGATRYTAGQDWEGAAFVWLGSEDGLNGGTNGNPGNAHRHLEIDRAYSRFGWSVSTAGDVNGDGYADVIVGAPYYTAGQGGEGGAWLYLGTSTGLNATAANHDEANQGGAHLGWSVATAGDVNGDGRADVIVGAPGYTVGMSEQGRAWVWYGRSTAHGISTINDWRVAGAQTEAHLGTSVATAGDVNGDGFSDVIVGAPGHGSASGRCTVYHGGPGPLAEQAGWTKASNQSQALFGTALGTAGDVNGDGYADVIVGAPYWDGGKENEGAVWVYLGDGGGLTSAPHFYRRSNNPGAAFGSSVGTAGDVNGDGYDDIIVGAPHWHKPETDEGAAFVYHGSSSGLDENAAPLWSKASNQEDAEFGSSVGTAGDVNGDGYADIIVGAPFWRSSGGERGAVWLYYGSPSGPHNAPDWYTVGDQLEAEYGHAVGTAGDVDGDGYSDVIVGSPRWEDEAPNVSEGRAWVYRGSRAGLRYALHWHAEGNSFIAQLGHAVGTAGDVNGDGYSDVIVGAPGYGDDGLTQEGKAWVFHGAADGLESSASWSREGGQNGAHYGWSVGTAGDVNGDGYADVIIGVELLNAGETNEGGASVYHGGFGGLAGSRAWHGEGNHGSAHYGAAVGSAGDVNGDGYADVIVGAPNYNFPDPNEGRVFLYYGNGQAGLNVNPRQMDAYSFNSPIARLGWSDALNAVCIRLRVQRPFGLGRARTELEVKPLGVRFDGTSTVGSSSWHMSPVGSSLALCVTGLDAGTRYHWRARLRYRPSSSPWLPASRWLTMPWNGWNEQDFRTAGWRVVLPVVLRD